MKGEHVVVMIDAVDELSAVNAAHSLDWLPHVVPAGIRFVMSTATQGNDVVLEAISTLVYLLSVCETHNNDVCSV